MRHRVRLAGLAVLCAGTLLLAGQPGEKAKGPPFKNEAGYTLVWGKVKTTADIDLGDEKKSRYSVQMEGSMETPVDQDVVGVSRRLRVTAVADDKNASMVPYSASGNTGLSGSSPFNAVHSHVVQLELPQTALTRDATRISKMTLEAETVTATKRDEVKLPAVVMEDFKDIGQGVSVRITGLTMSAARELTVAVAYKRPDAGVRGSFIEAIHALDSEGKDLGGGRWTEGDPFSKVGGWTAKFKIDGARVHQSFRLHLTTGESRKQTFDVKDIFVH